MASSRLPLASASLVLILAFAVWRCGSGGGGQDKEPEATCPKQVRGSVSPVNSWPGTDAELFAKSLRAECRDLIELEGLPWFPPGSAPCDQAHPTQCTDPHREERKALLAAMSAHKISVLINSHNSNAYGPRTWSNEQWREYIRGIREDAEETGADVWLGAPSEPWAWFGDEVRNRTIIARAEWPGIFVLPDRAANHASGQPYFTGVPYDYLEVHPCNVDDIFKSIRFGAPVLTVTDCGPVIASRLSPALAADLFSEAESLARPIIFYDHDGEGLASSQ